MRCDRFREAASARLDGEPLGLSASGLDHHLTTCIDCARWSDEAIRLTRQARLASADVPDLADRITAEVVLPARRVLRRRAALRAGLALAGLAQLLIALPTVFGDNVGMVMSAHANHEAAAWNLALAAAFLATAMAPRRAAGLIPLLATFVAVLTALSVHDVASGEVAGGRISTHLAAIGGLLLVLLLDRAERALPPGRFSSVQAAEQDEPSRRRLRGVA